AGLVMDSAGNLYGTTTGGQNGMGNVFELTPSSGGWRYTSLHDFTGGSDGAVPIATPAFDANGNLYGTTSQGGANGYGVVWEITLGSFTISASPASLSIPQGNQGTSTITTAISGGFNSPISLSASGMPTGTTVSFNPPTITTPGAG